MRPRLKAAENAAGLRPPGVRPGASMRPRLKAAENALKFAEALRAGQELQ